MKIHSVLHCAPACLVKTACGGTKIVVLYCVGDIKHAARAVVSQEVFVTREAFVSPEAVVSQEALHAKH